MHLTSITSALLLSFAAALPRHIPRDDTDIIILTVSNFGAFESSNPQFKSHASFTVLDSRPDYYVNTTCSIVGSDKDNSLYGKAWRQCDSKDAASKVEFWLSENFLAFSRPWLYNQTDPRTYVTGLTDKQKTYWSDTRVGTCANVTKTLAGTYYSRTTDWEFPIHTLMS